MASVVFLVFIVLCMLFLYSMMTRSSGAGQVGPLPSRQRVSPRRERSNQAAARAMRRAGYVTDEDYVQVSDVGLLAYRDIDGPRLVRYGDVLTDTEFLRPFVELWLPHKARGSVRLELVDGQGRLRYADQQRYELSRGYNTILPDTWLPLRGKVDRAEDWQLRVLAGDTVLAVHTFGWRRVGGGAIQRYVESDGELSPELQRLLDSKPREAISLSDLLDDQEE